MKRRQFVKRVIGTAAIGSTGPFSAGQRFSAGKVAGANDRVNVGLIGCGGRGRLVAKLMREVPNVEIAAVCDVYDPPAAAAKEWAGPGCRSYRDFRKLLEQKEVDAVVIATPDHWHANPAELACKAGNDGYGEKPLSHT